MPVVVKPLHMAKKFISSCIQEGDLAVDATAGNGHDTLFLASLVGDSGKVISFDVQKEALLRTQNLLKRENLLHRVELILDTHEHIQDYVSYPVAAIMFNLGYLPGSDHRIITKPEATVNAIKAGLAVLKPGGIITVVIYTGHEGGKEEQAAIFALCKTLNQKHYTALHYSIINQVNHPPSLLVIEKIH